MSTQRCTRVYSDVNFLPASYTRRQKLRSSKKRQAALAILMIAGMAILTVQTWRERAELQAHHDEQKTALVTTKQTITEVEKLHNDKAELSELVAIHRELYQPINYSQVTGTLGSLTPASIVLRGVGVETQKITTTRKMSEAEYEAAKKAAGSRRGKVKNTVATTRSVITVDLAGLAPSDVDVANFIGELAASNVFQNVKMVFSREGEWEGRVTREFRIKMEVPLDRLYVGPDAQEVADAD